NIHRRIAIKRRYACVPTIVRNVSVDADSSDVFEDAFEYLPTDAPEPQNGPTDTSELQINQTEAPEPQNNPTEAPEPQNNRRGNC
ncbi:hypothetical protein M9458_049854, partial [Cirrhinus mrigala]